MADIQVIINKQARGVRRQRQEIIDQLEKSKKELVIKLVSGKKVARVVRETAFDNPDRIIIVGGDGTVATAAHLLAKTRIELGIVPAGTTNSFARTLDLPLDLKKAIKVAVTKEAKPVNLGSVNGLSFVSVAAIGLSEHVASTIPDSLKKSLGRFAYFLWGTTTLATSRAFDATIKHGKKTYKVRTYQIVVANARLHGSIPVSQTADLKRDKLVLVSFGRSGGKIKHLRNLYLYIRQRHQQSSDVLVLEGEEFSVETKPNKKIEIDGEVKTKTGAKFVLDKNSLRIVR